MTELVALGDRPVASVPGVGDRRAAELRAGGIESWRDLLEHYPRRYIDRSRLVEVRNARAGEEVTLIGRVTNVRGRRIRAGLHLTEAALTDGTGAIALTFFNQPFRVDQLRRAATDTVEVAVSGKPDVRQGRLQLNSPALDILGGDGEGLVTGRVVPVHPSVRSLSPWLLRRFVHTVLADVGAELVDILPNETRTELDLLGRADALRTIHFPPDMAALEVARRRLAFDELFRIQVALALRRAEREATEVGIAHMVDGKLLPAYLAALPWPLTEDQEQAIAEITADMAAATPMHRLLQGEVGSGKTVVALAGLLTAVQGGYQGALMAPTEVLAEQHHRTLGPVCAELGVREVLLTSTARTGRDENLAAVASGDVHIVVGTHALIQEGVHFHRLGLAVVDEQHRFGVSQRVLLKEKGVDVTPDLLVMTATPIPRTLAMTLYGDLDVSTITRVPPGRQPITTRHLSIADEAHAWEVVHGEVAAGHQAYVICPLVEESEKLEVAAVGTEAARLEAGPLAGLRLRTLHGQMRPADKDSAMAAFRAGDVDVLVATTVVEVGVDVANATVIVVEHADRFGLSQLHQLRGRVGRGAAAGTCILLADPSTEDGEARLAAMVRTTDGFALAEVDLDLRGAGKVFDTEQTGRSDVLRQASLSRDRDLLEAAREKAFALVAADADLSEHPRIAREVAGYVGERVAWLERS